MPSFDIVSEVNTMEIDNALNQARKEIATRFDLKDSHCEIVLEKTQFVLKAEDAFKLKILSDILRAKLSKRGIHPKSIGVKDPEISPLGHARQTLELKQGIDAPNAKEISGYVRSSCNKVTSQIQGDSIRVSSKSRDDLQTVIAALKGRDFACAISVSNFRE